MEKQPAGAFLPPLRDRDRHPGPLGRRSSCPTNGRGRCRRAQRQHSFRRRHGDPARPDPACRRSCSRSTAPAMPGIVAQRPAGWLLSARHHPHRRRHGADLEQEGLPERRAAVAGPISSTCRSFPGPRSLPDTGDREWWVPLAALIADGVAARQSCSRWMSTAPTRSSTRSSRTSAAWWKSGDNSMQILRGGDAVMTMLYSSRAVPLAKSGEFDFTWNQAIRDVGNWAVLKGGPNTQNGVQLPRLLRAERARSTSPSARRSASTRTTARPRRSVRRERAALSPLLAGELGEARHRRLRLDRPRTAAPCASAG